VFLDGVFFTEIDRAMAQISAVEDHYFRGERCETEVEVAAVAEAGVNNTLIGTGWRAHRLGDVVLTTLLNYRETAVHLTVAVPNAKGLLAVWDPAQRLVFRLPTGRRMWTAEEMRKGIP